LKGVSLEVAEISARAGEDDQRQGGGMRRNSRFSGR
jgi:hypothetical protein